MADANFTIDVILNLIDKATTKALSSVEKSTKNITNLDKTRITQLEDMRKVQNQTFDIFKRSTSQVVAQTNALQQQKGIFNTIKNRVQSIGFEFLSLIFGGMALERIFGGINRAAFNTFRTFAEEGSVANKTFTGLSGSLTFLQFQLGKSIAENNLVQGITGGLTNLFNNISGNENKIKSLSDLTISLQALGAILFGAGTAISIGKAIGAIFKVTGISAIPKNLTALLVKFGMGETLASALVGGLGIALIAKFTLDIIDLFLPDSISGGDTAVSKFLNSIANLLLAGGLGFISVNPVAGAFLITAGIIIKFRNPLLDLLGTGEAKDFETNIKDINTELATLGQTTPTSSLKTDFELTNGFIKDELNPQLSGIVTNANGIVDLNDTFTLDSVRNEFRLTEASAKSATEALNSFFRAQRDKETDSFVGAPTPFSTRG